MRFALSSISIAASWRLSAVCFAVAFCVESSSANISSAAFIPNAVTGVTGIGSAEGDSADFGDGSHSRVVGGNGLTIGDPQDPLTWTHEIAWEDGWQHKNATSGTFILDLVNTYSNLDKLYIWNVTEDGSTNRGAKDLEIYYAATPTVTPTKNSVYNFASGGWTFLTSTTLSQATASGTDNYNAVIDLSSASSVRYVGIRMLNNYGGNHIGLAEAQVSVPEPAIAALLVLGMGCSLARFRRRKC